METIFKYLRHFILGGRVKVDQRKIEAMIDWPLSFFHVLVIDIVKVINFKFLKK